MGKIFERVITIVLENTMRCAALSNKYLNNLRKKGVFLTNSQGVTHPSQPNYICMIAGDTMGVIDDQAHYVNYYDHKAIQEGYSPQNIVDLLEANNLSWNCYVEDMPLNYTDNINYDIAKTAQENIQNIPNDTFPFVRKHVPFLSFPNIVSNSNRLEKIVNAEQFQLDLANNKLPHYSFYVPNLINDGHSISSTQDRIKAFDVDLGSNTQNIDQISNFLNNFLGSDPIFKFPPETLVIITFDEAYPYEFDYGIYTLLIGDFLKAGSINSEPVNHYNLLRSIEDNFGLGTLKRNDAIARPYWFLR